MKPKNKVCRNEGCEVEFTPFNSIQKYCSWKCTNDNKKSPKKKVFAPIRKDSKKRSVEKSKYLVQRIQFLSKKENKVCPITGQPTTDVHHQKGRIGSLLLDERFWIALSRDGHEKVENNPEWAKENAYSFDRLEKEYWIPVFGYEKYYECSNFGNIRSVDRLVTTKKGVEKNHIGLELSQTKKESGYLSAMLCVEDQRKRFNSHRLILQSFTKKEGKGLEVNHKNFKKSQNHINNLEWNTKQENVDHSMVKKKRGEDSSTSKLTLKQVQVLKRLYKINPKFNRCEAARKYGVSDSTIRKIIKNQRWKNI